MVKNCIFMRVICYFISTCLSAFSADESYSDSAGVNADAAPAPFTLEQASNLVDGVVKLEIARWRKKGQLYVLGDVLPAPPAAWAWPDEKMSKEGRLFLQAIKTLLKYSACYGDPAALKATYKLHSQLDGNFVHEPEELYLERMASRAGLSLPFFSHYNPSLHIGGAILGAPQQLLRVTIALDEKRYDDALKLIPPIAQLCDGEHDATEDRGRPKIE